MKKKWIPRKKTNEKKINKSNKQILTGEKTNAKTKIKTKSKEKSVKKPMKKKMDSNVIQQKSNQIESKPTHRY